MPNEREAIERSVERMGEALFHLSGQLRGSDWLASEAHHHTYEIVAQEWSVLTAALSALSHRGVTEEMVEAGVKAAEALCWDDVPDDDVRELYLAMEAARLLGLKGG
jgi:hypothetical protein